MEQRRAEGLGVEAKPGADLRHLDGMGDEVLTRAAALVGVWNMVEAFRGAFGWGVRLRAALVALAFLGLLWVAAMAHLIGWSLNY